MVVTISQAQFDALSRRPLLDRVAGELPRLETGLEAMAPEAVRNIAAKVIAEASKQGLTNLASILWFGLTMLRVHPRFAEQPGIAARLAASRQAGLDERARIADVVDETQPADWDEAEAVGGFQAYFAKAMRGEDHA